MEYILYQKHDLVSELNDTISAWISEKPQLRSLAHLGREAGVSDSALRRLKNQKVKISDDMIYRILSIVFKTNEFSLLSTRLKDLPNLSKWLRKHYSFLADSQPLQAYKPAPLTEDLILKNTISFSIYGLVSSVDKISFSYLKEQFGLRGEREARFLVEWGVLKLDGEYLAIVDGNNKLKISKEQTSSLLPELSKLYLKPDHAFNACALEIEAVNEQGYIRLMDVFEEFVKKASKVLEEYKGEIPVVVAGFMDSFTTQAYFEGDKNENYN